MLSPERAGLPVLLACYVLAMLVFAACVREWAPLHADTVEMAAWGRSWELGYSKHPPLGAWLSGVWFSVMPATNFSANLMAVLVAAGGLAGVWKLAGLYLDENGQRAAVLPLMLTPAFTVWAFKYNANAVLLLTWPWTAYFVLRLFEEQDVRSALPAGLWAALALLGKYYSVTLLASLFFTLLVHPKRKQILRAPALYLAAGVFVLACLPHVWWVFDNGMSTLRYATTKLEQFDARARSTSLRTMAAGILTLAGMAGLLAFAFRSHARGLWQRLCMGSHDPQRRWMLALAFGPLGLTILAHVSLGARIGNDFLLPVFIAVVPAWLVLIGGRVPERAVRRLAAFTLSVLAAIAVLSPGIGAVTFLSARHPLLEPRQELAAAVTDLWNDAMGAPLPLVAGQERLATSIAFYSADRPDYLDLGNPRHIDLDDKRIRSKGVLLVCGDDDPLCRPWVEAQLAGLRHETLTYRASHAVLGRRGPEYTFSIFMVLPR